MKVIVTAAGKGTRLLPATKEIPKEMLPVFHRIEKEVRTVPILQIIFEQLWENKIKNFCFVVGREKRAIEDHFTIHNEFLKMMDLSSKNTISDFYQKLNKSNLLWINQNTPKGFGDAVKICETFVGENDFLVHGGDVTIFSKRNHPISRLLEVAKQNPNASAILLCKKVPDTSRYGVPETVKISNNLFEVKGVEEKPTKPKSNFAIMPIYFFKADIIESLKKIKPGKGNEYQLTDAIQHLIKNNKRVLAISMYSDELEIDVGTANSYKYALDMSYKWK